MIHISLTTIPERIKNFELFYDSIMRGSMTPDLSSTNLSGSF